MFYIDELAVAPTGEPEALHPADASDELIAILRRIDRLEAQAAEALGRMNNAAQWRRRGYTSASAFLKHRAGFTAGRAASLVRRANALAEMPLAARRFAAGDLTVDQVDVLADAYNFHSEAYLAEEANLVELATQLPFVRELFRLLEYWKQRVDEPEAEIDKHTLDSLRGVRIRRDNGVGRLYICLSEEETDAIVNALDPGPPVPADTRTLSQRRADRLVELAAAAMDRPQLLVHVSLENLTSEPTADPIAETEYGTVLTPGAVQRIACDASVSRIVFGPAGQPIDVGRRQRLFTEPMRRAIIARDRHCRFPGCDRPPQWCDVHHIVHWLRGGTTCVENGILLCRFHHTLVHEAGWTATGTPEHFLVYDDLGNRYVTTCRRTSLARGP